MGKVNKPYREGERMIHIWLPEAVHRRLRIHVAEADTSIQAWVSSVIADTLKGKKRKAR